MIRVQARMELRKERDRRENWSRVKMDMWSVAMSRDITMLPRFEPLQFFSTSTAQAESR